MTQIVERRPRLPASAQPRPPVDLTSPLDRYSFQVDVAFPLVVILALLFNAQIGPLTPLITMGAVPLFMWVRRDRVAGIIGLCWPLLLIPAFAMLSTIWSIAPGATLRYSTLYLLTILMAVFIGAGLQRRALMMGIFLALSIYNWSAFLLGGNVGWGAGGAVSIAFGGLTASKNLTGSIAAVGLVATIVGVAVGLDRRSRIITLYAVASVLPCAWIMWMSHATGALIAGSTASFCVILWLATRYVGLQARGAIFLLILTVIVAAMATQSIWLPALFEFVLQSSGKDTGLTGRADLWRKADELIAGRPLLGLGFGAFWLPTDLDAEALWRQFGIPNKIGFNFHNTQREVVVEIGYVGLALTVISTVAAAIALFLRTLVKPDLAGVFFCAFLVYCALKVGFEVVGFGGMHFETILLFAALAAGLHRR